MFFSPLSNTEAKNETGNSYVQKNYTKALQILQGI